MKRESNLISLILIASIYFSEWCCMQVIIHNIKKYTHIHTTSKNKSNYPSTKCVLENCFRAVFHSIKWLIVYFFITHHRSYPITIKNKRSYNTRTKFFLFSLRRSICGTRKLQLTVDKHSTRESFNSKKWYPHHVKV